MAAYTQLFDTLGLRAWCDAGSTGGPMTMAQLMAKAKAQSGGAEEVAFWSRPFPSLDVLNESCNAIWRTRDLTAAVESLFMSMKDGLKLVLDPLTQPLSWALTGTLKGFAFLPWWLTMLLILLVVQRVTRSRGLTAFVGAAMLVLALINHFDAAIQTFAIILVCTVISVLLGLPIGIMMSKNDRAQKVVLPVLDLLQTLPSFVYLIPLIFLFSVTEPKLYGIAIILYAIVPIIRLTDLGIRLVDPDVTEAADAFGMTRWQKLVKVELPLAMPNIMAGLNQTIMMSLAMVVIASLVSAPGLGVLVLRGINNLELGVGLVAGLGIVLLAIILDRVTKTALSRMNAGDQQ
jgi:glycine betaine/proline transport system permease protein